MQHFMSGVNLGGWLSQYKHYDHAHFRTFITHRDIEQIASWGMDHVRLPVDYPVLEADEAPGHYRDDGFAYIDSCLEWCRTSGLGVIIDLHHAPGYTFTNTLFPETRHLNVLFDQEAAQQRFVALWEAIFRRYHNASIPLIFELLNEVVLPDAAPWNALAQRTVAALRKIDPASEIMIGGNHYNSVGELKNITLFDDPHLQYTFHFYEPLLFTHQYAPWVQDAVEFNTTLEYPGTFKDLAGFLSRNPQWQSKHGALTQRKLDKDLLVESASPALEFIAQTGKWLYCGEFGVYEKAPIQSQRNWLRDFISILRSNKIGRAVWSYKQMDFGLVDANGAVVDEELLKIVCQK